MGYYSDVGLALTRDGAAFLKNRLAQIDEKTRDAVNNLFTYADKHLLDRESGAECWQWNMVEWYKYDPEYFPDIDFLDKLLGEMEYEDYYFLCVGEDFDDIEQKGGYWDNVFEMRLMRNIFFDCDISGFQQILKPTKDEKMPVTA